MDISGCKGTNKRAEKQILEQWKQRKVYFCFVESWQN